MPFDALLEYSRRTTDAVLNRRRPAEPDAFGFALDGRAGQVYNEPAFRHFLALERRRSQRSGRSFLLLLVNIMRQPGDPARIAPSTAARLFQGLAECVREVDFVGWYREDRIAGAVLAQNAEAPAPGVRRQIADRVTATLQQRLPSGTAARLRVRVVQVRRRTQC